VPAIIILYYANRQHIHITQYKIQYKMRNIHYMFTYNTEKKKLLYKTHYKIM